MGSMHKNYESGANPSGIVMLKKSEPLLGDEIYIFISVPDETETPIQRRIVNLHCDRGAFEEPRDTLRHDAYAQLPVDHFLDEIPLGSLRYYVRYEAGIFTCGGDDLIQIEVLAEHDETLMFQLSQMYRLSWGQRMVLMYYKA